MNKSIKEHINFIKDSLQKNDVNYNWCALSDFNRTQIGFFQHERLVHLLVTLFFGLIFWISIMIELMLLNIGYTLMLINIGLLAVNTILLIVLIFYVFHYFFLENSIQKLYQLDKEITKRCKRNFVV
jgi:hypothetical protein